MSAATISAVLGDARRAGRGWRCRCPLHGGRSLVLRDGDDGRVLATCWGGCDRHDVLAELRRRGLLDGRKDYPPRPLSAPHRDDNIPRVARALAIWRNTERGAGTLVEAYLASRGIALDHWPASLRFHPRCPRPKDDDGNFLTPLPAMLALVEHVELGPTAVHATYLADGARKAEIERAKAIFGPAAGSAVRFGTTREGQWLAVAEGIETALSVAAACAMPAWAALSAGGISSLVLPPEATHVVICADHDRSGTGERAARDAAARWLAEGRHVRIAMPPEPDTDFNDVLTGRSHRGLGTRIMLPPNAAGAAHVQTLVGEAPEMTPRDTWPKPDMRLVDDDRPSAPTLDDDALPVGWGAWITAEAAARACPRDYVAAALLGAASGWIGNSRRIAATFDWNEAVNLWFALIGPPSTGKTPALRPMIEASRQLERDAEPAWRDALAKYECEAEAANAAERAWREQVAKAAKGKVSPPDRPIAAQAPSKPPRPRVVTMDTSTDELQRLLADNPRGLLHLRDELAGWLGSFDHYGGNGADRGFYLECWNGSSYVCDRVKFNAVPLRIEHASLSIIGGMVPDRLREALAEADDGLPARFFFTWPEPVPLAPLCQRGAVDAAEHRNTLESAARLLHALKMGADNRGQPAPMALRLDGIAAGLFDEQRLEQMQQARAASGLTGGWHGKNPGRLLRLALVFEYLAWAAGDGSTPEPTSVSADAVVRAGGFIDYAAEMFERVIAGLAVGRAEADAAQIARYVLANARAAPPGARLKPLNERSLYQRAGFSWARNAERRAEALAVMSEAAWLRRPQADGHGRPRGDWQLNPRLVEAEP